MVSDASGQLIETLPSEVQERLFEVAKIEDFTGVPPLDLLRFVGSEKGFASLVKGRNLASLEEMIQPLELLNGLSDELPWKKEWASLMVVEGMRTWGIEMPSTDYEFLLRRLLVIQGGYPGVRAEAGHRLAQLKV